MSSEYPQRQTVAALRQALPYLKLFQGKTFVVKFGGEVCEEADNLRQLFEQIGVLHRVGIRVVVVHGGGPQTKSMAETLGQQQPLGRGRRGPAAAVACTAQWHKDGQPLDGATETKLTIEFQVDDAGGTTVNAPSGDRKGPGGCTCSTPP